MQLIYNYISGHPTNIVANLCRNISAFERHYHAVKIGITSNPERCAGIMTKKYFFR